MKDVSRNMSVQAQKLKEVGNCMEGGHSNMPITKQKQAIGKTKHQKPSPTKCRSLSVSVLRSLVEIQMEDTDTR